MNLLSTYSRRAWTHLLVLFMASFVVHPSAVGDERESLVVVTKVTVDCTGSAPGFAGGFVEVRLAVVSGHPM